MQVKGGVLQLSRQTTTAWKRLSDYSRQICKFGPRCRSYLMLHKRTVLPQKFPANLIEDRVQPPRVDQSRVQLVHLVIRRANGQPCESWFTQARVQSLQCVESGAHLP